MRFPNTYHEPIMGRRLEETTPPDETGLDTFQRFAYQAHIAFQYCLDCYFKGDVLAVVVEHFEDVVIEEATVLRFLQIKTRNPDRGLWTFRDLCEEGGALRSLLRSHRALKDVEESREIRYEIFLEGSGKKKEFEGLRVGGNGPTERQVALCCDKLGIEQGEAEELLSRVTVRDGQPLRDMIEARNVENVIRAAGHLSGEDIRNIVKETVELIKTAMLAEIDPDDWTRGLLAPDTLEDEARNAFERKRIQREVLQPILSRLEGGDADLLATVADEKLLTATALERKMRAANATQEVIRMAKEYRARATIRVAAYRASTLFDTGAVLDDLDTRLLDLARTVAEQVGSSDKATEIWGRLHERTHQNPSALDRRGALDADAILLLGQICDLSDRCLFRWTTNL